jgi:PilZ domain
MPTLLPKCDRSYPLLHSEVVEAMILSGDDDSTGCAAELREISPGSAKLLVKGPPELSTSCRIRLTSSKLKQPLEMPAELDWLRPNPAGDWLVECEFQPRLSAALFADIVASGLLERRSAVRFQTRIPVQIEWLPGTPRVPGIVRDLSEGGLCLCLVTKEAPPDSRDVSVIADASDKPSALKLRIRWSLQVGPDYLIGCQFVHGDDFDVLRRLQPTAREHLHERSRAGKPASERS